MSASVSLQILSKRGSLYKLKHYWLVLWTTRPFVKNLTFALNATTQKHKGVFFLGYFQYATGTSNSTPLAP